MKKLGFRFSAIPRDRHPEWFEVPLFTRMLGHELYAASCDDGGASKPIPVANNWRTSLCRTLCIEPEDRPAVSQAFSAMVKRGLLKVEDDAVHVIWNPKDKLFSGPHAEPPAEPPLNPLLNTPCGGNEGGAEGGLWSATPRNDSTHVLQIREEKIRGEGTRAPEAAKTVVACRAPTPLPEPTQVAEPEAVESSSQARQEYVLQLSRRGLEHTKTLSTDDMRAFRQLGEFADAQAKRLAIEPVNVIRAVLDVFFDEPKMRERGWPPRFMRDRMLECFLKHPAAQRALEQVG